MKSKRASLVQTRLAPLMTVVALTALVASGCGDDENPTSTAGNNDANNGSNNANNASNNGSNNANNGSNNANNGTTGENNNPNNNNNNSLVGDFTCGEVKTFAASEKSLVIDDEGAGDLDGFIIQLEDGVVPAATEVSVGCIEEQSIVPEGFYAISAPIEIAAAGGVRPAYTQLRVPIRRNLVPDSARGGAMRIFMRFADGSVRAPAFVDIQEDIQGGFVALKTLHYGVLQVALPDDIEVPFTKEYVYRAITGVSMGAGGAALIGFRNPEKFDAIGALGGPTDWTYLLHYLRGAGTGGFCEGADPNDPDTWKCDTYTADEEFEHGMEYDDWYFSTGEGTGGTFDRDSYLEILQDLSFSFGNLTSYNPDSPFLPAGMPTDEYNRPFADRCPTGGHRIATGYFDDEYNVDGSLPVIAFCEGTPNEDKTVEFDRYCDTDPEDGIPDQPNKGLYPGGEMQRKPMEIAFAVDYNDNGQRDYGEPVIRNFWEPYDDFGVDGVANADEAGYDAVLNPDPVGDDYHWSYNPFGTEGNWRFDEGEPYQDIGIDGVPDTAQVDAGGYDYGEGNGAFDLNPNLEDIYSRDPRGQMAQWTDEERVQRLRNMTFYGDGGIRDIFNFAVATHQTIGAVQAYGGHARVYNDFTALTQAADYTDINPTTLDFTDLGEHIMVRYGDPEATVEDICLGDGKHVGEIFQTINRLLLMVGYILNNFPTAGVTTCELDGDCSAEEICSQGICALRAPYATATGNYAFDSAALGSRYRYSVALPPGYEMTQCSDGQDNDGDGLHDGDDPDCVHAEHNNEGGANSLPRCSDGVNNDNDIDNLTDFPDDPQCTSADDNAESDEFEGQDYPVIYIGHGYGQGPEDLAPSLLVLSGYMGSGFWPKAIVVFPDGFCGGTELNQCNDGIDNDGDGMADRQDPECESSTSEDGTNLPLCNDGVDNDLDGLIDDADKGCTGVDDMDEANCVQGTFYTDHAAYPDGTTPGPQYEQAFLELIDHIDAHYRTKAPETIEVLR